MGAVAFAGIHDGNFAVILVLTFTVIRGLISPAASRPKLAAQPGGRPAQGRAAAGRGIRLRPPPASRGDCGWPDASWHEVAPWRRAKPSCCSIRALAGSPFIARWRRRGRTCDFVYVADDAGFPYGGLPEPALVSRVVALMGELIETHRPDLVVIACNTASTIVLPDLRKQFSLPFVGTVPAIKPACAASVTKRVSVLGTEATVAREYTRALIRDYAGDCKVTLVGSKKLAAYAEDDLAGAPTSTTPRSAKKSRPPSSMTAAAPIRSCSPVRIIRC